MQGDFHSIFKGSGLEFDDVRPYQYGDDIRTIDWNVSAKGHGAYVKTFRETKEQTIFFILDVSASQDIGSPGKTKFDVGKELCGVLAMAGAKESSSVGLIAYSDRREIFLKPAKGMSKAYEMVYHLARLKPLSEKTNLGKAILFALNSIKRRSVIVMISDFIDEGYFHNLKSLARKHDLVMIHISDKRETSLPKLGIIPVFDKETKSTIWVNTSFGDFRNRIASHHSGRIEELTTFAKRNQINFLSLDTEQDYVPQLLKLFRGRNRTRKTV
jgi:uncharacterized protein (DUF58 family)